MYMEVIACRISVVLGTQCSSWLQVDPKRAWSYRIYDMILNKSVWSFLSRLLTWRCTLLWRQRQLAANGYIPCPRRRQLSIDICCPRQGCSKPASRRCCFRSTGQTDRQTDGQLVYTVTQTQSWPPVSLFWTRPDPPTRHISDPTRPAQNATVAIISYKTTVLTKPTAVSHSIMCQTKCAFDYIVTEISEKAVAPQL